MKLSDYKHVHCIGIGGIGLSAIARYCHAHGAKVQGSDGGTSRITVDLENEGIIVYNGHNEAHVSSETDLVIFTIAISPNNPEYKAAKERGITCMSYPEALGLLTKEYTTIAVCGTHGKTTTTAMIASMLEACGEDPTVIVGSLLSKGGTNFIKGSGKYLVVEACEYKRSFLNLSPSHIVVTNIDEDHLDYYKDINDIISAFQSFADRLPENGELILHKPEFDILRAQRKIFADSYMTHDLHLSVLGEHNKKNAQLAIALGNVLKLDTVKMKQGLEEFKGTWRRMEYKGEHNGALYFDDYGHHPREISATLSAIREKYGKGEYRLISIFQPHLYSRTKVLLDEFSKSFSLADTAIILPIYAARETDDGTVSSKDIVDKMENGLYMETFEDVYEYLLKEAHEKTVVLTIGAGDVYRIHDLFTFS